jgi:hypothetical protein
VHHSTIIPETQASPFSIVKRSPLFLRNAPDQCCRDGFFPELEKAWIKTTTGATVPVVPSTHSHAPSPRFAPNLLVMRTPSPTDKIFSKPINT